MGRTPDETGDWGSPSSACVARGFSELAAGLGAPLKNLGSRTRQTAGLRRFVGMSLLLSATGQLGSVSAAVLAHDASWPAAVILIALTVARLVFHVIALQQRRAMLREAYDNAPVDTAFTQECGVGSPAITFTIGAGSKSPRSLEAGTSLAESAQRPSSSRRRGGRHSKKRRRAVSVKAILRFSRRSREQTRGVS
jgi:hypothetical protein